MINRSLSRISPASDMKSWEWWRVNLKVGSRVRLQAPPWLTLETHSDILQYSPLISLNKSQTWLMWPAPPTYRAQLSTPPPLCSLTKNAMVQLFHPVQQDSITIGFPGLPQTLVPSWDRAFPRWNAMKYIHWQRMTRQDLEDKTKNNFRLRKRFWRRYRKWRRTFGKWNIFRNSMPRKWEMVPRNVKTKK